MVLRSVAVWQIGRSAAFAVWRSGGVAVWRSAGLVVPGVYSAEAITDLDSLNLAEGSLYGFPLVIDRESASRMVVQPPQP